MEDETNDYEAMWLDQAKIGARKHISLLHQKRGGTCNLFILDVSESMQGEGIQSLKRGAIDILDEYSSHPELDENVAVIVFGKETKFLHYYSNDYAAIKHSIENLQCSGPSPLTAAFWLAFGGLYGSAHTLVIGDFHLDARIVVFTDGRPTDFRDENATDLEQDEYSFENHSVLPALFSIVYRIGEFYPIYCFPVGKDPDHDLLTTISSISLDGRVLEIHKAKWFGRQTLHYIGANVVCSATNQRRVERGVLQNVMEIYMPWKTFDKEDLDTVDEILNNKTKIITMQKNKWEDPYEKLFTEKYATGPILGTRVRRGPHWTHDNQDREGPGTIVGHGHSEGLVFVKWDTGRSSLYGFGYKGVYDVVECKEPRYPLDGLVAVGCLVRRGPDWKWGDQDGGVGSIGAVYREMDDATVYVRWPCGRRGNYRFGYDGKFDIDVCDPFLPSVMKAVEEQEKNPSKLHSDEKSSTDLKGPFNVNETSKDIRIENKSIPINHTVPKQVRNEHTAVNAGTSRTHLTEIKDLSQCDTQSSGSIKDNIKTVSGFNENMPPNGEDGMMSGQSNVCSNIKSFLCSIENSTSDNVNKHDSSEASPEGISSDTCDEYKNNLWEKRNRFSGINVLSPPKDNLTSFWQNKCPNSKNENLQKIEKDGTSDRSQKFDNFEINSIGINCCWQWLDGNGLWIDYPEHINSLINRRLQQHPNASVVITYNDQSFRVVAQRLLQINTESKERHTIRWKKATKN